MALSQHMRFEKQKEVINEDVPDAFSHWTFSYTKGESLVVDLQGVFDDKRQAFKFTDPAIHSRSKAYEYYGRTDRGHRG